MKSNISQFLDRLKTNIFNEDGFRDDVCKIIFEKTGFPIEKSCVREMKGRITLKTDPYLKSEIMFRKNEILPTIKDRYPKKMIREII